MDQTTIRLVAKEVGGLQLYVIEGGRNDMAFTADFVDRHLQDRHIAGKNHAYYVVDWMDSGGGVFSLLKRIRHASGQLRVICANDNLAALLRFMFEPMGNVSVFDSVEAARRAGL